MCKDIGWHSTASLRRQQKRVVRRSHLVYGDRHLRLLQQPMEGDGKSFGDKKEKNERGRGSYCKNTVIC